MEIKVRKLKYSDRLKLTELIGKLVDVTGDDSFMKLISSSVVSHEENESDDSSMVNVGFTLIKKMFFSLESEMKEWFADLVGQSVKDFEEHAPFDVEVQILEQIMAQEAVKGFFTGASRLVSWTKKFRSKSENKKTK